MWIRHALELGHKPEVCESPWGFFIGSYNADGTLYARYSDRYFPRRDLTERLLAAGVWSPKQNP